MLSQLPKLSYDTRSNYTSKESARKISRRKKLCHHTSKKVYQFFFRSLLCRLDCLLNQPALSSAQGIQGSSTSKVHLETKNNNLVLETPPDKYVDNAFMI